MFNAVEEDGIKLGMLCELELLETVLVGNWRYIPLLKVDGPWSKLHFVLKCAKIYRRLYTNFRTTFMTSALSMNRRTKLSCLHPAYFLFSNDLHPPILSQYFYLFSPFCTLGTVPRLSELFGNSSGDNASQSDIASSIRRAMTHFD